MNKTETWRPTADTLYHALRERIMSGDLPPGLELRQENLARHYGVSRVPMREALSRLQAEGLIVLRPRRGFAVTSLDLAEIVEIFELRIVLEQHALEIAAKVRTQADVRAAETILLAMEKLDIADEAQVPAWLDLNHAFHASLISSANRQRLTNITCTLRDTVEPYIRMEFHLTHSLDQAESEHRPLFEAFRRGDAQRAGEISRDHCRGALNRLLASIRARGPLQPIRQKPRARPPEKTGKPD